MKTLRQTPAQLGYRMPAEWETHRATWLTYPHNPETWPGGRIQYIFPSYHRFLQELLGSEEVHLLLTHPQQETAIRQAIDQPHTRYDRLHIHPIPSNDAWTRDHGPIFLTKKNAEAPLALLNWGYNAWGGKYPPFDLDDRIPLKIALQQDLPLFQPGYVLEGGAIDTNGQGTFLTTASCLLNPNRNPGIDRPTMEKLLHDYLGAEQIIWLEGKLLGDDTDGHIDQLARFVAPEQVVVSVETDRQAAHYPAHQKNLKTLKSSRLPNGKPLNVVELPLPKPVYCEGVRLPASYANFYIANTKVVLPTFRDKTADERARQTLQACFPGREICGIDAVDLVWGLGSFHCLSQQEPRPA